MAGLEAEQRPKVLVSIFSMYDSHDLAITGSMGDMEKEIHAEHVSSDASLLDPGALGLILLFAGEPLAQFPGWDPRWPSPERMLAGCDPKVVRDFKIESAKLVKNRKDEDALGR